MHQGTIFPAVAYLPDAETIAFAETGQPAIVAVEAQ